MDDPKKRIAEMLRRVAKPVQMPRQAAKPRSVDDLNEGAEESLELTELPQPAPVNPEQIVERVATDNRTRDLGMKAFEKVDQGDDLSADEADISEAIILLELRPCIDIQNDTFGDVPPEWS